MNVRIIENGTLETETVNSIHFCRNIQATLIQPEEMDGNFDKDIKPRLKKLISGDGQGKRVDRLKTICTRLQLYFQDSYVVKEKHKKNLNAFFMFEEWIPRAFLYMVFCKCYQQT